MSAPPKPPVTLVAGTLVVLLGCLFLTAMMAAVWATPYDPAVMACSPAVWLFAGLLAFLQYRGTFCRDRAAAAVVEGLMFLGGSVLLVCPVMFCQRALADTNSVRFWLALSLMAVVLATVMIVYGKLNGRWALSLPTQPRTPLRFSIRELLASCPDAGHGTIHGPRNTALARYMRHSLEGP